MKNIYYFICCSLFLLVTSCDYDEHLSGNNQNGETITIVAHMPNNGGETKVSFNDSEEDRVLYVDWKDSGEKITLLATSRNETYVQTSSSDDAKNVFMGQNPFGFTSYAIYPSNGNASKTSVPYNLSEQTGLLDESKTYMYAYVESLNTSGTEFNFRHLTAIIKPDFNLAEGEKIQSVIVTLPENVYSKGTVNLENQTYAADGDNKRTINIVADNEEQIYIYVPAFQVAESVNIIFEIYTTTGFYTATKSVAKNIESGVLYEAEIDKTLISSVEYVWRKGIEALAPEGDGSEETPYLIATAKNLQWLLNTVNDGVKASQGKYYKLMHNIIINSSLEYPWTPIGKDDVYDNKKFYGNFDGNECVISGTLVSECSGNKNSTEHVDFGFFGYLGNNSEVKNLRLNLNVTGGNAYKVGTGARHSNTGILVGRNFGIIENCCTEGKVNGGNGLNDTNISHTGGIAGWNMGTIVGCTNNGTVNGGFGSNSSFTGGITGRSGNENHESSEIKGCVNKGEIIGGSRGYGSGDLVVSTGGIIGSFDKGSIHTSSNYGTISGDNNTYSAGVVGRVRTNNASNAIVYSCNKDYSTLNTIIGNLGQEYSDGTKEITITECTEEH